MALAIAAVRSPTWYPTFDWALMELRTRDVPAHLPLLGPTGRFYGPAGEVGHHLGPIDYYLVAPAYRLLGGSSFALITSTAVVNAAAIAVALWIAHRRGGTALLLGVGAATALLAHAVGAEQLVVPWNPWLPMLWWMVFLLAAWSVLLGDLVALPVLAVAGTICAQSHMAYVPSVAAIALGGLTVLAVREWRRPTGALLGWLGAAVGVFVALWLPVAIEQITGAPGNLSIVRHHFRAAAADAVGLGAAADTWLAHLDPFSLAVGRQRFDGGPVPGAFLVVALVVALVVTVRARSWRVASLLGVVAAAAATNLASISRIDGDILPYLVLWTWGTTALALLAIAWAVVDRVGAFAPRVPVAIALVVGVVATGAAAIDATGAQPQYPGMSEVLAAAVPVLVDELDRDARYMLRADDPLSEVGFAYGLLDALEREGFDVNLPPPFEPVVAAHRIVEADEVDAEIVYATGARIAAWRAAPVVRELVFVDAPPEDVVRMRALRAEAIGILEAAGLGRLAVLLDENTFQLAVDPAAPPAAVRVMEQMLELRVPTAIFVAERRRTVTEGG